MTEQLRQIPIQEIYGALGIEERQFYAKLDQSRQPRSPSMLYDKMRELGINRDSQVLDIGCGEAIHSCELARRFGCHITGIDPVAYKIELASQAVIENQLTPLVEVVRGRIESIPFPDCHFDFVWCRDMLNHVPNLQEGFIECSRVLKPGGKMLIWMTFATDLLETQEASRLYATLAIVPENMSPKHFERSLQGSGLSITERDVIGSEWREWREEQGGENALTSKQLLRIARMRRCPEPLMQELGRIPFEVELADCHWGVYTMLGKLCPILYIVRKDI